MLASSDGVGAKSFHIFHDHKFIPSRMTGEIAVDIWDSEYYNEGVCATVPFIWESWPGTPNYLSTGFVRLRFHPSHHLHPFSHLHRKKTKQNRKFVFPKFSFIRSHHSIRMSTSSETSPQSLSSSPLPWSSSSPAVLTSPVMPIWNYYFRRYGFQFEVEEEKSHLRAKSVSASLSLWEHDVPSSHIPKITLTWDEIFQHC